MRWRNLIILAAVLLLAGGAYYFGMHYEPAKNTEENSGSVSKAETIYQVDSSSVDRIAVKNTGGEYAFVKSGDAWLLESGNITPVASKVSSLSYTVAYITASNVIEKKDELSLYGLKEPKATLSVRSNGTETVFLLGDKTPTDNYYYFMVSGGEKIYTVSTSVGDTLLKNLTDYRDLVISDVKTENVRGIEINGENGKFTASYIASENENDYNSEWQITSPVNQTAASDRLFEKIITPACTVTAENIAEDNPQNLSKYGFDTDVKIILDEGAVSYKIGNANGMYYALRENEQTVYIVPKTSVEFLDVPLINVIQSFIAIHNIDEVNKITLEINGAKSELSIEHGDNSSYYVDGTSASEEAFKSMYQAVIGLMGDGFISHDFDESNPMARITYFFTDSSSETVSFYSYDDLNAAAVKGNDKVFFIKKTAIYDLENYLKKFKENPTERVKPR